MTEITSYESKKLVQHLCPKKKYLIRFVDHGLGDCVMFYPLYEKLKELYPDVVFNLKTGRGQEYFSDITTDNYDKCFYIKFHEFYVIGLFNKSKPEICCEEELGIPFTKDLDFTWKPHKPYKSEIKIPEQTIGIAFQVTSGPWKSIDFHPAERIWNIVKSCGYTPMEVHFEHSLRDSRNKIFSFVDNTCRKYPANVENVISVINQCCGFIGVNTGTFCMATAMKDGRTLHLFKRYHFCPGYKRYNPVPEVDCRSVFTIRDEVVFNYLNWINDER